jgi:hypothetical protein
MYFTLGIGRPLRLSGCSETARFVVSESIAPHSLNLQLLSARARHLLSGAYCSDDDVGDGGGGVAEPPVDLTMMSRTEKPSKNSNAANHNMVVVAGRKLGICDLLYDTMMMVVREPRGRPSLPPTYRQPSGRSETFMRK